MSLSVPTVSPDVYVLLDFFADIFSEPTNLPPQQEVDHKILLLPSTAPVNLRPYHYTHWQKNEIEHQVAEMLHKGIIRHSSSHFSSLVLLVGKLEGTWLLCTDYRRLTSVTIPVADELFDELYGSVIFSKLDLCSGYHQIRMANENIEKIAFHTHKRHYEYLVMPFGSLIYPPLFRPS